MAIPTTNINTLKRNPDITGPDGERMYMFVGPMKEGDLTLEEIVDDPSYLEDKFINLAVSRIFLSPKILEVNQYCDSNTDWQTHWSGWKRW